MKAKKIKKKGQQGQVLLISIMLLAVVMTVIFSASFTNVTETKVTKLEEESQRALAAAEAGVEAMIAQNTNFDCGSNCSFADIGNVGVGSTALFALGSLNGIDTDKSQVYFDKRPVDIYIAPTILQNGEQYTLYLADPPDFTTNTISDFIVYWGSMTGPLAALEITVVNQSASRPISRYLVDPNNLISKESPPAPNYNFVITTTNTDPSGYLKEGDVATGEKEKVRFKYQTPIDLNANSQDVGGTHQYAFVRILFANSRLAFEKTGSPGLPAQGKTAVADVVTNAGVNKAVKFFRTYQQLPAEFFITTF